jgi:hypothetical protein
MLVDHTQCLKEIRFAGIHMTYTVLAYLPVCSRWAAGTLTATKSVTTTLKISTTMGRVTLKIVLMRAHCVWSGDDTHGCTCSTSGNGSGAGLGPFSLKSILPWMKWISIYARRGSKSTNPCIRAGLRAFRGLVPISTTMPPREHGCRRHTKFTLLTGYWPSDTQTKKYARTIHLLCVCVCLGNIVNYHNEPRGVHPRCIRIIYNLWIRRMCTKLRRTQVA